MLFTFRATTYQGAGKNRIFIDDIKVEISKRNYHWAASNYQGDD